MDAEAVKKFFVTYYRIGSYTKNYEYTNVTLVSSSNQKLGGLSVNSLKSGKGKLYHDYTTNWKTWSYIAEIPFHLTGAAFFLETIYVKKYKM